MYRLIKIEQYAVTRWVELLNLKTGVIESCFDDSRLVSDRNFSFMKIGGIYDCGIKLFGRKEDELCDGSVLCRIKRVEMIGRKTMTKVMVGEDEYYVPSTKLSDVSIGAEFYFSFSRKDLIWVDSVIHGDFLRIRP